MVHKSVTKKDTKSELPDGVYWPIREWLEGLVCKYCGNTEIDASFYYDGERKALMQHHFYCQKCKGPCKDGTTTLCKPGKENKGSLL